MQGKTCVVTGANSGIGKATSLKLAEMNAQVVMVCRNKEKGKIALEEIKKITGNNTIDLMICDFASIKSIRNFAEDYKQKYKKLDVLINNHGIFNFKFHKTEDGFESMFAVNYLGSFLLTNLLLDVIKASSPARIIVVSSNVYKLARKKNLYDYNFEKRRFRGFISYAESKLYIIMTSHILSDKLKGTDVTINSLHPGFTKTNMGMSNKMYKAFYPLFGIFAKTPEKGAQTSIYLASSPEVEGVSGGYFINKKQSETSEISHNKEFQHELWELSKKLCNLE